MSSAPILQVKGLSAAYLPGENESFEALRHVDFEVAPGEIHGLIGESGSGKTTLARAVLGISPTPVRLHGEILFEGQDLLRLSPKRLRRVRGALIGYVHQDAAAALNPYQRIGSQIVETIRAHRPVGGQEARRTALESLAQVGLPRPQELLWAFPHQLSIGMCQRALIAVALSTGPRLLLADEPTAALDPISAVGVIEVLKELNRKKGLSILLITHDLNVLFQAAHRATVLREGEVKESDTVERLRQGGSQPYTQSLLAARLTLD